MPLLDHFHPPLSERPCIRLDLDATYMRTLQEQRMLAGATTGN